jgi:hypothetical protein
MIVVIKKSGVNYSPDLKICEILYIPSLKAEGGSLHLIKLHNH